MKGASSILPSVLPLLPHMVKVCLYLCRSPALIHLWHEGISEWSEYHPPTLLSPSSILGDLQVPGDPTPQCSVLARGEGHVGPVRARAVRRDGRRGPAWEGVPLHPPARGQG